MRLTDRARVEPRVSGRAQELASRLQPWVFSSASSSLSFANDENAARERGVAEPKAAPRLASAC